MNKQIEEMAEIMEKCCNVYDEKGNHIRNKCNEFDCEHYCETNNVCCSFGRKQAEALYNAGYRKVDDFVMWHAAEQLKLAEETAREILQELYLQFAEPYLNKMRNEYYDTKIASLIKKRAEKYGVEVE